MIPWLLAIYASVLLCLGAVAGSNPAASGCDTRVGMTGLIGIIRSLTAHRCSASFRRLPRPLSSPSSSAGRLQLAIAPRRRYNDRHFAAGLQPPGEKM